MTSLPSNANTNRFQLGITVATPGALAVLDSTGDQALRYFRRHAAGDWGDVVADDARANEEAVAHEGDPDRQQRVVSVYLASDGTKLYVITEWDRSVTTLLRADEY